MDQDIRNKLRNVVTQCRRLLEDECRQALEGKHGIFAKKDQVTADPNAKMTHLTDEEQAARKDILGHFAHIKARGFRPRETLDQLVREIAFTHLNRFCAYKMMEAREVYVGGQKFREAVSRGVNSNGVKFYLAEHPDEERLFNTGHQDVAYRHFLDWLGGLLSEEIGVLFNPNDPANRLYPRQKTLDQVLDLLNGGGIKPEEAELRETWPKIWSQDETIGWVYQFFTPKELRDQARKESQAPRNSYELAFRNQFFTPRYVVEFLTDNTLGRIWYEMRKGDTKLKDQCGYMVRRPTEVFGADGEANPSPSMGEGQGGGEDLSQEELLKLPVHIPHRPKKDPRELMVLDPACGSGHFLLYCFDLLLTIYEEAYADPDLSPALQKDYPTLDDLRRGVPRLILAHNLHGIDIDLRASQIAALALWLRCQRAYQEMGLKKDRPKITRSNIVCAEPMPGEDRMLNEFAGQLEPRLLAQVVEVVFDKMKLAGEAGSLLKVEEDIGDAVAQARKQWLAGPLAIQRSLFDNDAPEDKPVVRQRRFDLSGITNAQFFEQAEVKVVEALRNYAEEPRNGQRLQRRLFADDAVRGFAFVDLCHKRFDVVLMNPPFGNPSSPSLALLGTSYTAPKHDIASAFLERALQFCRRSAYVGSITTRTLFFLSYLSLWRQTAIIDKTNLVCFSDFGYGVLEATVETAAHVFQNKRSENNTSWFCRAVEHDTRQHDLASAVRLTAQGEASDRVFWCNMATFAAIDRSPFAYAAPDEVRLLFSRLPAFETADRKGYIGALTQDDFRFVRAWWETDPRLAGRGWTSGSANVWVPCVMGGSYSPYYADCTLTIDWTNDGETIKRYLGEYRRAKGFSDQWTSQLNAYDRYFTPGLTWSRRPNRQGSFWCLPEGVIFSSNSPAVISTKEDVLWLLGVVNSRVYRALLDLLMPRGSTGGQTLKYEVGYVRTVPIPEGNLAQVRFVREKVIKCIQILKRLDSVDETSHRFCAPFLSDSSKASGLMQLSKIENLEREREVELFCSCADQIDEVCEKCYGLSERSKIALYDNTPAMPLSGNVNLHDLCSPRSAIEQTAQFLSWMVGALFGRWNFLHLYSVSPDYTTEDPFAPLPMCPAALLQEGHLPANGTFDSYPVAIARDGVIPDDPNHVADMVQRLRKAFETIWFDSADSIEGELCLALGLNELREYFRRPGKGGFWEDHVSRYCRSHRKAPIYWLLQSSKKNYALWLYYHRLDKDLLFKALVNYVEPKIKLVLGQLSFVLGQIESTKDQGPRTKDQKKLEKEAERLESFLSELRDFADKLRRAANLRLEPDLNDGVVLNIAPLHELVPWKEARNYWEELLQGKYEWSSIGKQLREKGLVT